MTGKSRPPASPKSEKDIREEKLKQALRDNLMRRKAKARAVKAEGDKARTDTPDMD